LFELATVTACKSLLPMFAQVLVTEAEIGDADIAAGLHPAKIAARQWEGRTHQ
jgi:hypothetical protein